jgi:thiamine pyrophosphate-dependent acetolactate synthase large subunit-like protein
MKRGVQPAAATRAALLAAARAAEPVAIFAEPSSAMFYLTRELADVAALYSRISTHYGSMGHGTAGAIGFCAATGQRALVLTGDGSFHLMNPLPTAVKHGLRIATIVLNDSRLALPQIGCKSISALAALSTTDLPRWDFTRQGSPRIGGRAVEEASELEGTLDEALAFDGCFVVDVDVDPHAMPPVGARLASVAKLFSAGSPTGEAGVS